METLLTNKTVSVTELREPRKVIDKAGSQPVAVLNRSNVGGNTLSRRVPWKNLISAPAKQTK